MKTGEDSNVMKAKEVRWSSRVLKMHTKKGPQEPSEDLCKSNLSRIEETEARIPWYVTWG